MRKGPIWAFLFDHKYGMHCWYDLKIRNNYAIGSHFKLPKYDPTERVNMPVMDPKSIFNKHWLEYMESVDFPITYCVLLHKPALYVNDLVHIDVAGFLPGYDETDKRALKGPLYAFNWVLSGTNSDMIWYQIPPNKTFNTVDDFEWPVADAGLPIDIKKIGHNASVIRIDMPHSIAVKSEARWALSARSSRYFATWDDLIAELTSKNLIVLRN